MIKRYLSLMLMFSGLVFWAIMAHESIHILQFDQPLILDLAAYDDGAIMEVKGYNDGAISETPAYLMTTLILASGFIYLFGKEE